MTKFSIIIPVKEINDYVKEAIPHLLNQSYKDFEIIIFPDKGKNNFKNKKIKVIETGKIGPAEKRDLALKYAKGEILAFIDDDAYPEKDWLENAVKDFENETIGAVGGPNLTPENDNEFQKVSGFILSSPLVSGGVSYRYKKGKRLEIDDFPSCNLFVRKEIFKKINGFDSNYYPGEDTKLCLEIRKSDKKIIYNPEVIVYHHRRNDMKSYLKQIFSYAKHRGYFAKKLPETSLRIQYFIPSFFLIGLVMGPFLSLFNPLILTLYLSVLAIYILLLVFTAVEAKRNNLSFFLTLETIFLTHIIYGIGLIIGLMKKEMKK